MVWMLFVFMFLQGVLLSLLLAIMASETKLLKSLESLNTFLLRH